MNSGFSVSPRRSPDGTMGRGFMSRGLDGLLVEPSIGAAVLGIQDNGNRAHNNSYVQPKITVTGVAQI